MHACMHAWKLGITESLVSLKFSFTGYKTYREETKHTSLVEYCHAKATAQMNFNCLTAAGQNWA